METIWLNMLVPPWRHSGKEDERVVHWFIWLVGWIWAVAGLILGAVIAPSVLARVSLSNMFNQDALDIVVAVLAGFFVQFIGWIVFALGVVTIGHPIARGLRYIGSHAVGRGVSWLRLILSVLMMLLISVIWLVDVVVALVAPLAAVGYAIYRYLTWEGPGQARITITFVGALLVKTFVIPFIKGMVSGALFKWFLSWLHGGKTSKQ